MVMFWRGEIQRLSGWTDPVGQALNAILEPIKGVVTWVWDHLIRPGVELIISGVKFVLSGISGVVQGIASTLQTVWASILAGLNALGSTVSSGLGWLGGELTKATSWIWKQMEGFFSSLGGVLKQIGTWIVTAIRTHVVDPILALLKPVFEGLGSLIGAIFQFITQGAVKGSPIEWRGSYTRWIGIVTGVGAMAVSGLVGAELINLVHPFKDTKAGEIAKFALQFSGFAFLMSAFYGTYFDIACAKPVRQELNSIFTPELPGSGDLIRFMVREVIVPDEFYMAMALQGFSKYWSAAYFEAHWMLPPSERTRTAFLRKQIPEAEYRKFLIWYDFKPDPRPEISLSDVDIMLKTQYDWPGKIDIRWLIEWAIITPEQGGELLKSTGLDPEWAPRVLEAYLLNQLREELGKVRGVYEDRLEAGFMSKTAFAEALHGIHFATHVINALVKWADEKLDLDEKKELAKEYEALAKAEAITVDGYGEKLRELGMVEERITRKQRHIRTLVEIKAAKEAAKG